MMDAKEFRLVSELHTRISRATFHERDVLALLILMRPRTDDNSPARELSDFVAHREKDRGALQGVREAHWRLSGRGPHHQTPRHAQDRRRSHARSVPRITQQNSRRIQAGL